MKYRITTLQTKNNKREIIGVQGDAGIFIDKGCLFVIKTDGTLLLILPLNRLASLKAVDVFEENIRKIIHRNVDGIKGEVEDEDGDLAAEKEEESMPQEERERRERRLRATVGEFKRREAEKHLDELFSKFFNK